MMRAMLAVVCSLMVSGLAEASISVTGTGKVKYVPDIVHLSLGASSDVEKLLDQARLAAVTDARKKADLYARGAGAGLGLVRNISEGALSPWRSYELAMPANTRMANAPLPIAPLYFQPHRFSGSRVRREHPLGLVSR